MKIINWKHFLAEGLGTERPVSLTTGVFDGLHRGHMELVNCLLSTDGTLPVVATFSVNPFRVFNPEKYAGDIATVDQKLRYIEESGCEAVILIDFSMEFSKLSGRDFFFLLRQGMNLSHLVIGKDHRLGRKGGTGAEDATEMLRPYGIKVDIIEPLIDDGLPVSSTRIRKAIIDGDFETASRLSGRRHELDLKGVGLNIDGSSCYFRRTDIKQVIPFSGEYAANLTDGTKTFATKTRILDDRLEIDCRPDIQVETLIF